MISRSIPPPVAVQIASTLTPKISIRCRMPVSAPEIAKATVPIISRIVSNENVMERTCPPSVVSDNKNRQNHTAIM